jgi:hypothetical protein
MSTDPMNSGSDEIGSGSGRFVPPQATSAAARTKMSSASVIMRIMINGRPARRRSATRSMPMPMPNMTSMPKGNAAQMGILSVSNSASTT